MPVRFRCPECEGLLSIARRKIGSMVECPKCRSRVVVPAQDDDSDEINVAPMDEPVLENPPLPVPAPVRAAPVKAVATATPAAPRAEQPLFERDDFETILGKKGPSELTPAKVKTDDPVPTSVPHTAAEDGIFVSRGAAIILAVLMVVLLVLAFATGYLIGS